MYTTNAPVTILRMHQLCEKLGIGRSTIYEKINPKSPRYDWRFPKPIKLGAAAVGWVESEVDWWIKTSGRSTPAQTATEYTHFNFPNFL